MIKKVVDIIKNYYEKMILYDACEHFYKESNKNKFKNILLI